MIKLHFYLVIKLQDLRGINESSKAFFQPQLQQHMKYGTPPPAPPQQQQPQQQQLPSQSLKHVSMPDSSTGSLRELSPCHPPQQPLPLRTPPLYSEADIHNGSPTSSSSGPYASLQNMAGSSTSHSGSASIQPPDAENDSSYSLVHGSQNSLLSQPVGQSVLLQAQQQQPAQYSTNGMLAQQQRGHSPHQQMGMAQPGGQQGSQNGGMHPHQGTATGASSSLQNDNSQGLDADMARQQGACCAE